MVQARTRLYGRSTVFKVALSDVILNRCYRGDEVSILEKRIATVLGVQNIIATPTARVALYLLVKHTVSQGKNIVMSPLTICDVVNMVICAGARPKFADVKYDTCNLNPEKVREAIDGETGAVIVTHLHGLVSDIEEIRTICNQRGVPLIEDAAQAFGAHLGDAPIGTLGDSAAFSFGLKKNVNALFGGIIATRQGDIADAIRHEIAEWPWESRKRLAKQLTNAAVVEVATSHPVFAFFTFPLIQYCPNRHSRRLLGSGKPFSRSQFPEYFRRRFTPMQARLVLSQIDQVDADTTRRRHLAKIYRTGLSGIRGITMQPERADYENIYYAFPILLEKRQILIDYMQKRGRDVSEYSYHNLADLACFADFAEDCPMARKVSESNVYLPIYPSYSDQEARANVAVINDYFSRSQ